MRCRKFLIALTILGTASILTGCFNHKEYNQTKKKGKQMAIEYIKEKYGEDLEIEKIYAESMSGSGLPFPDPNGTVKIVEKNSGYNIFVNTDNNIILDDKQLNEVEDAVETEFLRGELFTNEYTIISSKIYGKYYNYLDKDMYYDGDIKGFLQKSKANISLLIALKANETFTEENRESKVEEYKNEIANFLDEVTPYFNGEDMDITIRLYKPDKYMNEDVKAVVADHESGNWGESDRYIATSEYLYLKANATKEENTNTVTVEYIYDKFIPIAEGIAISSEMDRKFQITDDIQYNVYSVNDLVNGFGSTKTNFIADPIANKDNKLVLSKVYDIKYGEDFKADKREYLTARIDKRLFENGKLLDKSNKLGEIFKTNDTPSGETASSEYDSFWIRPFSQGYTYEEDNYTYITFENQVPFVIYTELTD